MIRRTTRRRSVILGIVASATCVGIPAGESHAGDFDLNRAQYFNPRLFGMGGAFTAVSNDRNLYFMNPSGLAHAQRNIGFEFLPVRINNNAISAINFYSKNDKTVQDLENLSDEEQAAFFDDLLAEIGGKTSRASAHLPIWVSLPSSGQGRVPHLGFGFFARGGSDFLTVNGASGVPLADLGLDVQYTGIASAAYSWDTLLPGRLSFGGSVKIDHRRLALKSKSFLAISGSEDIDFLSGTGFGLDLGALYEITPSVRVGAAVFDVVASDFTFGGQDVHDPLDILNENDVGRISTRYNLGVAWLPTQNWGPLENSTFAFDLRELGDSSQNFWTKIYVGGETHLNTVALRAGFYQGYPSGGFGLGPLQYAYFSNELGKYPGTRSNYQHALSFAFRFGI